MGLGKERPLDSACHRQLEAASLSATGSNSSHGCSSRLELQVEFLKSRCHHDHDDSDGSSCRCMCHWHWQSRCQWHASWRPALLQHARSSRHGITRAVMMIMINVHYAAQSLQQPHCCSRLTNRAAFRHSGWYHCCWHDPRSANLMLRLDHVPLCCYYHDWQGQYSCTTKRLNGRRGRGAGDQQWVAVTVAVCRKSCNGCIIIVGATL